MVPLANVAELLRRADPPVIDGQAERVLGALSCFQKNTQQRVIHVAGKMSTQKLVVVNRPVIREQSLALPVEAVDTKEPVFVKQVTQLRTPAPAPGYL